MSKIIDLTGQRFNRLIVIERLTSKDPILWKCKCECGKYKNYSSATLRHAKPKSCGCSTSNDIRVFNLKHGQAGKYKKVNSATKEYNAWLSMRGRCADKSDKNYGMRGIKVCSRWLNSFENFFSDMGKAPSKKHSIDRINNNGNYEPRNCRWATQKEQCFNKNNTSRFEYKGQFLTIDEAIIASGNITNNYSNVRNRLNYGWTFEEAVEKLPRKLRSRRSC